MGGKTYLQRKANEKGEEYERIRIIGEMKAKAQKGEKEAVRTKAIRGA